MLEIPRSDAIIHPRTMMVHPTNTPIANPAMVGKGWFECLALGAHGEGLVWVE